MVKKIGFIGAGVMGKSMIRNLRKNGFEVTVYTRSKEKAEDILSEGAAWADNAGACAKGQDVVITIVGYPKDVEEVYFGSDGILENAAPGTVVIDMTTSSPQLAEKIYAAAAEKGIFALDAPVSGGDSGAKAGTLSIMVGGDEDTMKKVMPVFEAMGKTIMYEGGAGCGQHTKMANQIALSGCLASVCEAITYARKAGLDTDRMFSSISQGAVSSWQLSNNGPKILHDDFAPGFFIKHYIKDMRIACQEGDRNGATMPILHDVLKMFESLDEKGMGELGTQALIKYYEP